MAAGLPPKPTPYAANARLVALLGWLKSVDYSFVTATPSTHGAVLQRAPPAVISLRDILGWNRPFELEAIPGAWRDPLLAAGILAQRGDHWAATVRVSSLGHDLFIHSAFPPDGRDAVFFGPDTYRFARFLEAELQGHPPISTAVDLGAGSGAGAVAAWRAASIDRLVLLDVSPAALETAAVNLKAAAIEATLLAGDGLAPLGEPVDLIIANPPFMAGTGGRIYRDGGDMHGARLSLDWALEGAQRLLPAGRMLLYTGSAIVDGVDGLKAALADGLDRRRFDLRYAEIDPDIFGEMLRTEDYREVERIAAVGAVITRKA